MEKYIIPLLLVFLPSLSLAKVPFYYYNQPPSSIPQLFRHEPLHVAHAPLGAFHYTNFHNESEIYPSPEIRTECQVGSYCTVDSFCTVNVTISVVALNLTEEEKEERGELIPCWHVESQSIEVCCNIPTDEPPVEVKEEIRDTRQCPRIPKAFSESSCSDVASTCGSVGYSDPKCPNSELCCFDGCANRCISDLSPEPEPSSTASETISNFLSTSQSSSYHTLPYRHYSDYYYPYHHPQNPHTSQAYHHSTSYTERPFQAYFPQSPSYTISSGRHAVVTTTPVPTTTSTRAPRVYSQYPSSTYEHFPSNSYSYQQSYGYVRPLSRRTKTHEALTQNTYQTSVSPQSYSPVEPQIDTSYESYYGQTYTPYTPEPQPTYAEVYETVPRVEIRGSNREPVYHESCPSALKCVPKKNCDFNGVIVSHVVSTSPEFDTVRVPLLPCTNAQTGETDVCCRDPNFVDPYSQY